MTRPVLEIPDAPKAPYPITVLNTTVIPGFGRGSTEMGIPTANVPITTALNDLETGVYFGYVHLLKPAAEKTPKTVARIDGKSEVQETYGQGLEQSEFEVLPMVMSLGWNPYFKNKEKACEIHILHKFKTGFYGCGVSFNILGYIRPELDYTTMDALIKDIHIDIDTAAEYLAKPAYEKYRSDI